MTATVRTGADDSTTASPQEPTPTHTVLRAEGLTCPSCVSTIERQLRRVPGVVSAVVKFASGRIDVEHDAALVSVTTLEDAVARAGYTAKSAAF
ncbi:MAG TPA: heavy metal-associated domain-containing protein [Trueperaceae bacterium]|nr:heavy metal-associated domain-containing protein [Trueperaceae bacterium]